MKLLKKIGSFFNLLLESLVEARKARADAIHNRIGR